MNPTAAAAPVRARAVWLIWTVGVAAYILRVRQLAVRIAQAHVASTAPSDAAPDAAERI